MSPSLVFSVKNSGLHTGPTPGWSISIISTIFVDQGEFKKDNSYSDDNKQEKKMSEQIIKVEYKGYTATAYGESSISIVNSSGREVFHTGFSKVPKTEEELKKVIDFYIDLAGDNDGEIMSDN